MMQVMVPPHMLGRISSVNQIFVGSSNEIGAFESGVAARLLRDAARGVDQDHREVGGAGAGDHVARVLLVAGRVGDDEAARGGREVAVGHVDGDALLALEREAVGEEREVHAFAAAARRGLRDRRELVFEEALGVEEEAPDERALSVVHRACRREPKRGDAHQK